MTWRLRKETAGSGALGDIASHAIDQIQHLLGDTVTGVSGRLHTFTTERPGPEGPNLSRSTTLPGQRCPWPVVPWRALTFHGWHWGRRMPCAWRFMARPDR